MRLLRRSDPGAAVGWDVQAGRARKLLCMVQAANSAPSPALERTGRAAHPAGNLGACALLRLGEPILGALCLEGLRHPRRPM